MLDSLEFVHKLSQHFNARADAAERMLSPDLRRSGVMMCTSRASRTLLRLACIVLLSSSKLFRWVLREVAQRRSRSLLERLRVSRLVRCALHCSKGFASLSWMTVTKLAQALRFSTECRARARRHYAQGLGFAVSGRALFLEGFRKGVSAGLVH